MDQEYQNARTSVSHHHHQHHQMRMTVPPPPSPQPSPPVFSHDSDQSTSKLHSPDCNLTSLCDHIQSEGFGLGLFSDIVVKAMRSSYHLHLANSISQLLLQDLCTICTDFIISELGTYFDLRNACWGYLCQNGVVELREGFGVSHGATFNNYYCQDNIQNNMMGDMENVYVTESSQGEGIGIFKPVRINVKGQQIDGFAGIGCEATFVPPLACPLVYSRVPININGQQPIATDGSEGRIDQNGEILDDGLIALVGLSQGTNSVGNITCGEQNEKKSGKGAFVGIVEPKEPSVGSEWENESCTISLDTRTPLCHFPPFRFGVEFEDVHRLANGHVEHSPEFFYAGSLWKINIQAFNDEDPQGRGTIGLFLHRWKAEIMDSIRKVHLYVDPRDKVTARYHLIYPLKREMMKFGNFKQRRTLLPKAPKVWGWHTALLFDELSELLQNGALRIDVVVQLV